MKRLLGAAALLAGCGSILPEKAHHDAAPEDAGTDASDSGDASLDGGDGDAGCKLARVSAEVTSDTVIVPGVPGLNFGDGAVANVGVGVSSVGLFGFEVASLAPDADVRAMRVRFDYAATSSACNAGCASCDTIDATGNMALFYLRPDWREMTATWNQRDSGAAWGGPGAALGGVDRSESPIATARHEATTSTTLEVEEASLADANGFWRVGDEIAFLLAPSAGAVFVIATRESAAEACTPCGYSSAILEIDYCPE